MRIALAQINPVLGNAQANHAKIVEFIRRASEKRADVVVFSELALLGYPPNDLLERPEIVAEQLVFIKKILRSMPAKITAISGAAVVNQKAKKDGGKPYQNVAVVTQKGKAPQLAAKQLLPSYDIFDETRFFEPGSKTLVLNIPKVGNVAISICEDMWCSVEQENVKVYKNNPLKGLKNIDLIVNISASPFSKNKMEERLAAARFHTKALKAPMVYVNQVCGQDELLFDGRSFVLNEKGQEIVQASAFAEDLVILDLKSKRYEFRPEEESKTEILRQALVMGIREFVEKTGQNRVHLGLSGGIDSAVVAALAVDALGPSRVTGLLLPGPYSSEGSVVDSEKLAKNLRIGTVKTEITGLYEDCREVMSLKSEASVSNNLKPRSNSKIRSNQVDDSTSLVEQNLQARLRGLVLMTFSNSHNSMLLSTSNKCELACGYSTLYGDTNGGLMPIGDLVKKEIYELAHLYNGEQELIPKEIITKAPSAELAPGQKDQDNLPAYDLLDKAIINVVENKRKATNKTERWLLGALKKSEFKRWQAPPILRVSQHGFGRGRRMPIARA